MIRDVATDHTSIPCILPHFQSSALGGGSSAADASEARLQTLSALSELLAAAPTSDQDSVFRGLVALGTLCLGDAEMCALAKDMGVQVREWER